MRVLWAACAQPGSLFPAVPLVQELAGRGHRVTAIADGTTRETFAALDVGFVPAARRDKVGEAGAGDPDVDARRAWHRAYVQGWFADAIEALSSGRYDVVLADPLEPGAAFAAELAGVPSVSYAHWAIDEAGPDLFFATHLWDRDGDAAEAFVEFWNDQRAAVGLPPDPRPADQHRWYRHSPQLALVLGLPELVHPTGELPAYARRVGPSVWAPPRTSAVPNQLQRRDSNRDLVLVSVSTVGPADQRLLTTITEAVRGDDVDVLVTTPNGEAPAGLPSNVTVVPFLAHDADLLAGVDLVVSHAGYGSVTRAACSGLPMLLFPRRGDQFAAARGAVHAGLAISLDTAETTETAVRDALARLRTNPDYRSRARSLAAVAARYQAPARAAEEISRLA
jgi:UDP:flavonoid glycosyltransferase YjiC (YdhE family)